MRKSLRRAGLAAGVLLLGVALSECGSSSSGGGGGNGNQGGSPGNGGGPAGSGTGGSANQGGTTGNPGTGGTSSATGTGGTGTAAGTGGSTGTGGTSTGQGGTAGTGGAAGAGAGTGGTSSTGTGGTTRDAGTGTGTGGSVTDAGPPPPPSDAGTGPARPVAGLPEYWISPAGSDAFAGTQASPFYTLTKAISFLRPGTASTIWVTPGTYSFAVTVQLTQSGTQAAPFNIKAVAGAARPIFNYIAQPRGTSNLRGIDIPGDWWHITGIDIENTADNCINIGGSNNTIENVVVHNCGDTGIQITVDGDLAGDATKGAHNTILNCDSWGNFDPAGPGNNNSAGENADGFACKLAIGAGNVFRGCRSWNNSDDGWDFFAANDVVTVDNCWAFSNGKTLGGQANPDGDGNGFKLGGAQTGTDLGGAIHVVTNSFAFENLACGFTRNNNPRVPSLMTSGSARNGGSAYCPSTSDFTMSGANNGFTMTAAQAMAVVRNADGSLPAIH